MEPEGFDAIGGMVWGAAAAVVCGAFFFTGPRPEFSEVARERQEEWDRRMKKKLMEKWGEALQAVLPIIGLVLALCFCIAPVSPSILLCFLAGAVLLMVGMMFFTLGAEMSMSVMGERVGACLTKTRSLPVMIGLGFLLGFVITISEPDLQVLAELVPSVPNMVLILAVACGVGLFLVAALLRMLFSIALPPLLFVFYGVVFLLSVFVPKDFLAVAFDSGGVTTGPMTVPFIMALGVGICAIRSDRHAADDSFGLVALCSVGPILAVMVLGMVFRPGEGAYTASAMPEVGDSVEMFLLFAAALPRYLEEIASEVRIPCLRKDFTVDEYMIYEAKALGASAVLLICSILSEKQIREYLEICDILGMSALVETHDEEEIRIALRSGARMIGVNNRNLKDFTVDTENSRRLRELVPEDVLFISESGVSGPEDVAALRRSGADAVLVGEALMRAPDKKSRLRELRGDL